VARAYELKRRAEGLSATRERIVEATVELHESLGPGRTTISAIADRAGVQRLTVYRHFADERALFAACSGHWSARNPLPDFSAWAGIVDPEERLRVALISIYGFFRATEGMTGNLLRDLPDSPALQEAAEPFRLYWQSVRGLLERGWAVRGRRRHVLQAVIRHALEFDTWKSLARAGGLADEVAADAMVRLAHAVRT
jgi:AcrR family transcriptional regulator